MIRSLFKFLACALCLVAGQSRVDAAYVPVEAAPNGERFLFVVDMSEDIDRLQAEIEATIYDMIATGFYGQMQPGDTYGVWTFNKETYAGRFPMQIWETRRAAQLGAIAAAYLSGAPYEKSSDMQQMMGKLMTVVQAVSNLTVFVISDGKSAMRGTPFDKAINAEYKKLRRDRNAAKRPLVTMLSFRTAWAFTNSVQIAGVPIKLPDRIVLEPPPKKSEPPKQAEVTPKKKATIIASPVVQAAVPVLPEPEPTPAPVAPAIVTSTKPATQVKPIVARVEPILAPATPPTAPDPALTADPAERQVVTQSSILAAAEGKPPTPKVIAPEASLASIAIAAPSIPAPKSTPTVEAPAAKRVSDTTIAESALAVLIPEPIHVAARETSATETQSDSEALTPIQGAALPIQTGGSGSWLMAFGGFLLASALFLAFTAIRRARPAAAASLITQSMNRR